MKYKWEHNTGVTSAGKWSVTRYTLIQITPEQRRKRSNGGKHVGLEPEEIDDLCERINK